ncbi:MAG TPA: sodium:proton exchanger [Deltaproteobacteria bacterium]|nr:sodium:proton exchanger [Deltaproteobacteria bacterium]
MHGLLPEIGISILAATALGFVFQLFRQPVILGYLVAGALIGPEIGLKLVVDPASIEVISEIGLILLLFIIGLELDPAKMLSSGKQLIFAGVGQFALCVIIGLGFYLLLSDYMGTQPIDALYLSIFCALSSTAIVVKLLYDKFELDTIPGRITLGILIFQDIWAILVLALQPHFMNPKLSLVALALGKSFILLSLGFLLSRYVLKWIFDQIAKTPEMVVAMSIAWCVVMAGIASWMGLSMEMGALIAGVSISSFPYGVHIIAKVLPLRDFFLTLFFLSIGMKIPAPDTTILLSALVMVVFVIASRFLTIYPILTLAGSGRRTSFIASLNLSQISEFSLVIAMLGITYGHIEDKIVSLVIYAMAITSVLASYMIKGNHATYLVFNRFMERLGFGLGPQQEQEGAAHEHYPVVLLGYHRGARAFIEKLAETAPELIKKILVIDFNLEVLKELKVRGVKGMFGDIGSMDTLDHAHIRDAHLIISTIPDMLLKGTSNEDIIRTCRPLAPQAVIMATADSADQIGILKRAGANEVILPYSMIGDALAGFVEKLIKQTDSSSSIKN